MGAIITVTGVSKVYGNKAVVDAVSFSVNKGEVFGILGPNGAGKTTTLEMMEALRPLDKGSITVAGVSVIDNPQKVKESIGIQLQSSAFFDRLSLREQLDMFAGLYGVKSKASELLEEVQLSDKAKSYAETLSGGQKQRFSIATALVNTPKVLFLDEPTTGLDPQSRRNLWELVQSIQKKGITIVLTTHYMEEAELLCDRVAIMDKGKIIALDSPKRLITQLLKRGFKKDTQVQQANLEDVFIDLTGKELRET
jgi:ABC-2 type transport system ATP-binding protein